MIFKVKLQVQPNTWKALLILLYLSPSKSVRVWVCLFIYKSTVFSCSIWIRPSQFFRSALNLTDTIRKLHVFSLLSFHFCHGNTCKALRYTPFVTPSVRDCSLCLILQVAQCFLDLRNLPNKMTEKAFPVPSSCSHLIFLLLLFFFCSACASCLAHCESIISSPKTNTKIVSIQRPVEELRRVALNLLMEFCIPFSFCVTWHCKKCQES